MAYVFTTALEPSFKMMHNTSHAVSTLSELLAKVITINVLYVLCDTDLGLAVYMYVAELVPVV